MYPSIKLPVAAPNADHCICSIRQIRCINRKLTFRREPITNRAGPISPKVPFSGPIQIFQHGILLSKCQNHVDGFYRQRNCSPGFHCLAGSALPAISTAWQAMHACMIWYLAGSVRMAVYCFSGSVQIRICANFCTGSPRTHAIPKDHTSCELRVFAKRFFAFMLLLTIRML